MPSDLFFKTANGFHKTMMRLSGNRLGATMFNMPVLELTTIGRRSGQRRSVMLTAAHIDGDTLVVVASRGGDPQHPAWFLNVRDNGDVTVAYKGNTKPMRAHVADADERARLWPLITTAHKNYADYQKRAEREIPLVLLEPAH